MRAAAVVQARMGSTRLPGKVLRPIAGKPLLWHILHRLKQSKTITDIAVATSTNEEDDAIAAYALEEGAKVVRGPEDDVLERYRLSAEALDPDIIVRIVGDAPLVDPDIIDMLVNEMSAQGSDFVMLKDGVDCIHDGVDPFSRRALETLLREARHDPVAKEHVTGYFKDHPEKVRIARIDMDPAYQFSGARTSIDTPDDIRFLEAVYDRLGATAGNAYLPDVVSLLKREPELMQINKAVRQKATTQTSGIVIMRCDASPRLGFGHLTRCLALARALRDTQGLGVRFAITNDQTAKDRICTDGFPMDVKPDGESEEFWIEELIEKHKARSLVLDVRTRLTREAVARLKTHAPVCVIDDGSDRRLEADLAIYPPVPQVRELDWDGFTGDLLSGWDVVMLADTPAPKTAPRDRPSVLLSMGGADPAALTVPAMRALMRLDRADLPFDVKVVVGPAVANRAKVMEIIRQFDPRAEVLNAPSSLTEILAASDIAITSFGVTAYEAAAAGAVGVSLCLDEDHLQSASIFEDAGIAKVIDARDQGWTKALRHAVQCWLGNPSGMNEASAKAASLVDGKGAARIAARIGAMVQVSKVA